MKNMIKGITVTLHNKVDSAQQDAFGSPIYTENTIAVEDVLIGEPTTQEIIDSSNLYGKQLAYTLAIPKGDNNEWENSEVEFFGKRFRTFGNVIQGIEDNVPLRWNKKVKVESYGND